MNTECHPIRRLKVSYVCALSLIALLAVAGHRIGSQLAHERASDAYVINLAGRQRMLSERAVKLMLLSTDESGVRGIDTDGDGLPDTTPRDALRDVFELLGDSHAALASGDPGKGVPLPSDPALQAAYAELGTVLDALGDEIRASLSGSSADESLSRALAIQSRFVHAQNAIVDLHEGVAERSHRRERLAATWLLGVTLLTLVLVALLVFEPAVRAMRELFARLVEANADASWQATHDALTHLPSRRALADDLAAACEPADRTTPASRFALLFLDFDGFKAVNDVHGHDVGDALLCSIGRRLLELAPFDGADRRRAYRLAGDEFVLLLCGADAHRDAPLVADEAIRRFEEAHALDRLRVVATVSVGIVLDGSCTDDPDTLLRNADSAMRRAKALGKSRFVLFDSDAVGLGASDGDSSDVAIVPPERRAA